MKRDLSLTFLTQVIVLIAGLYTYRLARVKFSDIIFADYALIKRNTSFLFSFFFFGFSVAIPRYVSIFRKESEGSEGSVLIFSTIFILSISVLIFLTGLSLKGEIAYLLFGSRKYSHYILPFLLMLTGMLFHSLPYSFFRGRVQMVNANLLQLLDYALIPVVVFIYGKSLRNILIITGTGWLAVSLFVLILLFFSLGSEVSVGEIIEKGKILISYGIQRIPADFGLSALLSLPPIVAAHIFSPVYGGYTAFAVSLVRMVGALFAPLGIVLLPVFTSMVKEGKFNTVRKYVTRLVAFTTLVSIVGILIYFVADSLLLRIYLGSFKDELLYATDIFISAAIGYNVFVALRSFIDAVYFFSINTVNIVASVILLIFLIGVVWMLHPSFNATLIILSSPLYLLGLLTFFTARITLVRFRKGDVRIR